MLTSIRRYILLFFTWTYTASLQYYTLDPIVAIEKHQHDPKEVQKLLRVFRRGKKHELHFIKRAVSGSVLLAFSLGCVPHTGITGNPLGGRSDWGKIMV